MASLGGKASITELIFTIGDADARRRGNAGKGNGVALKQLPWGNALLGRKAKAIGRGYGLRLRLCVTAGIVRLIVVTRGGLTRRWLVWYGLWVAVTASFSGRLYCRHYENEYQNVFSCMRPDTH